MTCVSRIWSTTLGGFYVSFSIQTDHLCVSRIWSTTLGGFYVSSSIQTDHSCVSRIWSTTLGGLYVSSSIQTDHSCVPRSDPPLLLDFIIQWKLTIKTTHWTSWNGLNTKVVSILNYYFSRTESYHDKIGEIWNL